MNIHPEMAELRSRLDTYGITYETDDIEDIDDEWSEFVIHSEKTVFRSLDGRVFSVLFSWSRDEDEQKRFLTEFGMFGYLECKVGDGVPYAAYCDEILEDAIGRGEQPT